MTGQDVTDVGRDALPLRHPGDLDPVLDRIGVARLVLIGEASHGTSEFYRWRAELTRRLVVEKGFSFIGVEGSSPPSGASWPRSCTPTAGASCARSSPPPSAPSTP
jgi:hypothetical protein